VVDDVKGIKGTEEPITCVDALVRDACAQQRANGVLPTPDMARDFVQPIVEKMDNKPAPPTSPTKKPGAFEAEYGKRSTTPFDMDGVSIEHKPVSPEPEQEPQTCLREERLRKRIQQIIRDDKFGMELKGLTPALNGFLGRKAQLLAQRRALQLLDETNERWGDWEVGAGPPLWFT
jgi:hypothetical protein